MFLYYLFYSFNFFFFFLLLVSKGGGLVIVDLLLSFHLRCIFKNLKDSYNLNLRRRKELRFTIFFTDQIEMFTSLMFPFFFLEDYTQVSNHMFIQIMLRSESFVSQNQFFYYDACRCIFIDFLHTTSQYRYF